NPLIGILPLITAAQIAFDRGHLAEAKQLFDQALSARDDDPGRLWTLHASLAELYVTTHNPLARTEYLKAIQIIDENWSKLINDNSKLTFPSRAERFYNQYVDFLMARHEEGAALEFVESHRARLLIEKAGGTGTTPFPTLASQKNAVLLSYW